MLFLRYQVEEFAWKKWGSPEALDTEWQRRVDEKKKKKLWEQRMKRKAKASPPKKQSHVPLGTMQFFEEKPASTPSLNDFSKIEEHYKNKPARKVEERRTYKAYKDMRAQELAKWATKYKEKEKSKAKTATQVEPKK